MLRRFVTASAIACGLTAALLTGSSGASTVPLRGAHALPAGLAATIRARLGVGASASGCATAPFDQPALGTSVAISADGTTAIVGAPGIDEDCGTAYVFHVSGVGTWSSSDTPTAVLTDKHALAFGTDVALSADGTTAFVGAPETGGSDNPVGAIYAFHVSAEGAWTSTSTPTATLTHGGYLGFDLALSADGTTLVAGQPFGGAYVFHAPSEDAWASTSTPTAVLSNAHGNPDDFSPGFAVAISGDGTTALVDDYGNPTGGGAWLYHVDAEDAWSSSSTPTAILTDANSPQRAGLGYALALSGDGTVAVLGAPLSDFYTGKVDVFHASGPAAWATTSTPAATLTRPGGLADTYFGQSVSVSADGATALVGAPGVDVKRGAGYIFHVADAGSWASTSAAAATLTDSGAGEGSALGSDTALIADGSTALLGEPGALWPVGAADVFHVADASSWASSSTPAAVVTVPPVEPCIVPKLIGLTVSAAKARLTASNCSLGKVQRVPSKKGKKGRVVSQSRAPGAPLVHGANVNVKVKG